MLFILFVLIFGLLPFIFDDCPSFSVCSEGSEKSCGLDVPTRKRQVTLIGNLLLRGSDELTSPSRKQREPEMSNLQIQGESETKGSRALKTGKSLRFKC